MDSDSEVFGALRKIMLPYAKKLACVRDDATQLYVNALRADQKGKPVFFGAVQQKKAYVSFHLMGVYFNPRLLEGLSPELRKRMQGKSCFNFKQVDPKLFRELSALTERCFDELQ